MFEREAKLVVDDCFVVPELQGVVPDAELGSTEERQVVDVYRDTADLRLARWGCTLRYRSGQGWTVKIPAPSEGLILNRQEVVVPGSADELPDEAVALVESLTRGAALAVVAELNTRRLARTWRSAEGTVVAELTDDTVTAHTADGRQVGFRELEVELGPATDKSVMALVMKHIRGGRGTKDEEPAQPKLVRVLGKAAREKPDVVVPRTKADPSARRVIRAAFSTSVSRMMLQLPAARLGLDPEGVHQARVATRRLRSDLQTFQPLLKRKWATALRRELSWLADELGRVRDADVLGEKLRAALAANTDIDPVAAADVLGVLSAQRDVDRARLLEHLSDERALELLDRLVEAAASPSTTKRARRPARDVMPALVHERWHRLRRAVERLDPEPLPDQLHDIRILAKRVRYASEAVSPAVGKSATRFAKSAAEIQRSLGELNDAVVAKAWLGDAAQHLSGPSGFAAGQLAQQLMGDASVTDEQWRKAYRRMTRHDGWLF
ncbi:MAG: CHAD domain-containing protein [Acidimicrobiales bacterium]